MLRIAYKFNLQKFKIPVFNPLLFSTSSTTDVKIQPFTNYLVNSLNFTPQQALSISKKGIRLLASYSDETIETRRQIYKSFGWSDYHVSELMRRSPLSFTLSEENIRNKLDFLTKAMGYKPEYLISRCAFFTLSLEKRMLPRYRVLQVLKERGLLPIDYKLYVALLKSERDFLEILIKPYKDDEPGLLELYQNSKGCSYVDSLSK